MRPAIVIPVRGGSKGIARKNLSEITPGVSLLERTIDQALRCFRPETVLVSTEDDEMAAKARARGARVIDRPPALARDDSTTASVVTHLLDTVDPDAALFDAIMILQVTSPLRRDRDVTEAVRLLDEGGLDSVVSAFEVTGVHPAKMYFLDGGIARSVAPEFETARRQDLPPVYRRNGAIFLTTRAHFLATGRLWGARTGLVVMPEALSVDIDGPVDLEAARRHLAQTGDGLKDA